MPVMLSSLQNGVYIKKDFKGTVGLVQDARKRGIDGDSEAKKKTDIL